MEKLNVYLRTEGNSSFEYCNEDLIKNLLAEGKVGIIGYDLLKKLENWEFIHLTFCYPLSYQVHSVADLIEHINLIEDVHSDGCFRLSLHADLIDGSSDIFETRKKYKHILFTQHNLNNIDWEIDEDAIEKNISIFIQQRGKEVAKEVVRQFVNEKSNMLFDVEFNFDSTGKVLTNLFMPYFKIILDNEADNCKELDQKLRTFFDVVDEYQDSNQTCYLCYHGEGDFVFTLIQVASIISGYIGGIGNTLQKIGTPRAKIVFCVDELH